MKLYAGSCSDWISYSENPVDFARSRGHVGREFSGFIHGNVRAVDNTCNGSESTGGC